MELTTGLRREWDSKPNDSGRETTRTGAFRGTSELVAVAIRDDSSALNPNERDDSKGQKPNVSDEQIEAALVRAVLDGSTALADELRVILVRRREARAGNVLRPNWQSKNT